LHETFRITYSIDTNTYNGGGSFLDNVAIKVGPDTVAASLFAAPGGIGNWAGPDVDSGINAGGCSGSGGNGFLCVNGLANSGKGVAVTTGNGVGTDLFFIFDVVVPNGQLSTAASIKARYVDASGNKTGTLLSENITLQIDTPGTPNQVPEPGSFILVGIGFLALRRAIRKFAVRHA
jgi:hypothetical protein